MAFNNVFDALEADPAVAQNLKLRAALMSELRTHIEAKGWTQRQAADVLEVSQPRISDLMNGKIDKFTIDMLVNMLGLVGKRVALKISAKRQAA